MKKNETKLKRISIFEHCAAPDNIHPHPPHEYLLKIKRGSGSPKCQNIRKSQPEVEFSFSVVRPHSILNWTIALRLKII